jgi:uncharacterized protein YjbI with pentapeptide repeats
MLLEATRFKRETGQDVITPQERLLKYERERGGGYFVHFSNVPRMGLFLQNKYGTPIGFYGYPLKAAKMRDFAVNRPYQIVFKPKPEAKILDLKKYTEEDLERDLVKLSRDPVAIAAVEERGHGFQFWVDRMKGMARVKSPGGHLWAITRLMSQADKADAFVSKVGKVGPGPDPKNPNPKRDLPRKGGGPTGAWTMMFRRLGYDGVVDSAGQGIIHPAERYQGVFFDTTKMDLIEIVERKKKHYVSKKEELFLVKLHNRKLNGRDFSGRSLAGALFTNSELKGANFSGAVLTASRFERAKLDGANMYKANLKNANLSSASLVGANLEGAKMEEVNCRGSDFSEANLQGVELTNAQFQGCLFVGADLRGTKFLGSYVYAGNFSRAKLENADLSQTSYVEGATFKGASYNKNTKFPEDFNPEGRGMVLSEDM